MIFSPRLLFATTEKSSFANVLFIYFLDQISTNGEQQYILQTPNIQCIYTFVQTNRYSSQKISQKSQVISLDFNGWRPVGSLTHRAVGIFWAVYIF